MISNTGTGFYGLVDTPTSRITTTNATPTVARSFTSTTNSSTNFAATVSGKSPATGEACSFNIKSAILNNAGSVTLIGSPIIDSFKTAGAASCDASVSISGTTVRILVTGIAAQTWNWVVSSAITTSSD